MSIRIFGSGGGVVITDATASPSNVLSGKIFYNNDGKQVGTLDVTNPKSKVLTPGYITDITPLQTLSPKNYKNNVAHVYKIEESSHTSTKIFLKREKGVEYTALQTIDKEHLVIYSKYNAIGVIFKKYAVNIPICNIVSCVAGAKGQQSLDMSNLSDLCDYFFTESMHVSMGSIQFGVRGSSSTSVNTNVYPIFNIKNEILANIYFGMFIPSTYLNTEYILLSMSTNNSPGNVTIMYYD